MSEGQHALATRADLERVRDALETNNNLISALYDHIESGNVRAAEATCCVDLETVGHEHRKGRDALLAAFTGGSDA